MLIALLCSLRGTIFLYQGEELGLPQADVPFELFDLVDIPAVSNQWWAAIVAARRQLPLLGGSSDRVG